MELQGKVALVTGASRGIGAQIAIELAQKGANLFITWTASQSSCDSAANVMKAIHELGNAVAVHGMAVDLSTREGPQQVVEECMRQYSHIDILVNNAGSLLLRTIADTSTDEYQNIMDLNLRAPFLLIQAALPHLRKPARIINVSSIAARTGFPLAIAYSMSKAGLEGLTRSLAKQLGPDGTTVNSVAPGIVQTEMLDTWEKEWIDEDSARTPVERRTGRVEDVAQVVTWLACGSSRWISGQTISASGGALMI